MSDRGMKKWNAYRALPEHDPSIKRAIEIKNKRELPTLLDEEKEIINLILTNYHGQPLEISYFRDDELYSITTSIKKIDATFKRLVLPDRSYINFDEIVKLKELNDEINFDI
jgi:hypothetical protein